MRFRSTPVTDRLVVGDESVVLVDNVVIHLSPVPTAIYDQIGEWADLPEIAEALETRFGPPPDGATTLIATESALRDLEDQGLVERDR